MKPVAAENGVQIGRTTVSDPNWQPAYLSFNLDFSNAEDYLLDFATVDQTNIFGTPKALFVDNSSNPSTVEVSVYGSDQFFIVPAFSGGIYKIDSPSKTRISFVSAGGATYACTFTVYNYDWPPVVWYAFGPFNADKPIMAQGTEAPGTDMDTAPNNYPVLVAGVDNTGALRRLLTDATGALVNTVTIPQPLETVPSPVTISDFSAMGMSGASQEILPPATITQYLYMQAPVGNVGSIWVNLTGGAAVIGLGIELAPGDTAEFNLGIVNSVEAIAATIGDDLTIYGG